jgi:RNA polymerase sigma factor (sigma-70 family)
MIKKIDYKFSYKNDVAWKIFAMEHIEVDIIGKAVEYSRNMPQTTTEDIVQDLRSKVWVALDSFDRENASLRTYINRVIKNYLIDLTIFHNRKKRNYVCPDTDLFSSDMEHELTE